MKAPLVWRLGCALAWFAVVTASPHAAQKSAGDELLSAVLRNESPVWQALLAAKADVTVRDADGNTPLHFAALNHDVAAVRALLTAGAPADARNAAEATPLIYGAGQPEIVRALLAHGANANAVSTLKSTPLTVAVAYPESYDAVRLLLEAGADVHAKRTGDTEAVLPAAITGGDRRTIDLLLERGAGSHAKTVSVALANAAAEGRADFVRLLLKHGGDPNYLGSIGHSLNRALFAEQRDMAQLLLEAGAKLDVRSTSGHGTPTMVFAAYNQDGDAALVRRLVGDGADVNVANDQGMTALAYALRTGPHTPLVDYLHSVGAKAPAATRAREIPSRPVPAGVAARAALARERLQPTIDLLHRSSNAFLANGFVQQQQCTSCHGQDLPLVVYDLARARGFRVDDASIGRQLAAQMVRWKDRSENARQMMPPIPGVAMTLSYGMFGLKAAGYPADGVTDAMARYLMRTQKTDGRWDDFTRRPPMEDGTLVATGWAALSVRDYAPAGQAGALAASRAGSAQWLARQQPVNHNEIIFQLLGLHWSGEPAARLGPFVERLVRTQRKDGGWAQLAGLESDAWATGTALYALHKSVGLRPDDPVYQRGVEFLLRTQFEDGSWWVRSRAWPFQPHFNGQFPHGKDQWISQGASAWAAMALLFTLEPMSAPPRAPSPAELIAAHLSASAQTPKAEGAAAATTRAAVDFARDIEPLFKRSCVGCHGGEKPRAGFALTSRDRLLKGGASGEPAIAPGDASASLLVQYVSGKIEDLEMPPLGRREKYPGLSAAEIELLRAWIDSGAPWPTRTAADAPARRDE